MGPVRSGEELTFPESAVDMVAEQEYGQCNFGAGKPHIPGKLFTLRLVRPEASLFYGTYG